METYGGMDVQIHVFLTSVLIGEEWLASRPGRFTSGKEHWFLLERRLGGSLNRSGRRREEKILALNRDSNSDLSSVKPVASRSTDCAIPAHVYVVKFTLIVRRLSLTSEHVTTDFTATCIICHL
jgi:hypothetical protein